MNIVEVKETLNELLIILEQHESKEVKNQKNEIKRIIYLIESGTFPDECQIKKDIISLYPARGGLTDFYIWIDDENKRIDLNTKISQLGDNLWKYSKMEND